MLAAPDLSGQIKTVVDTWGVTTVRAKGSRGRWGGRSGGVVGGGRSRYSGEGGAGVFGAGRSGGMWGEGRRGVMTGGSHAES